MVRFNLINSLHPSPMYLVTRCDRSIIQMCHKTNAIFCCFSWVSTDMSNALFIVRDTQVFRVVAGSKLNSLTLMRFEIPSPASLKDFWDVMEYGLLSGIIISQEHVAIFFSETMMSIYQTERRYTLQYPGMETVFSAFSRSLRLK